MNYDSNMIIRKRKVSEYSTLSTQEKALKSKRKKERDQAENEMTNKDSKKHALLHYGLHAVDEETSSFDKSDVEPATDYQSQAECGSSRSDSDDQMRVEPIRDSPTVQTMDKSSNTDSRSERREEDDVREEQSLFTTRKSFTSESEKGQSVGVPPRQKKSKSKAKKRKVSEDDSTLSKRKQEKISKNKRKKERCQGEDEMVTKDTKQNKKKKWKKERKASYYHIVVPAGTDVINANGNVNDNGNAHEEVVDEHTVAAMELVEEQSITEIDGNVTSLERRPALHSPPPDVKFAMENIKWNTRFVELEKYKEKNGHCNCPTKNGSLGSWITKQRKLFKSNKLKEDRHEKLVEIGFIFEEVTALELKEKLDQQWQDMYQKLLEHKETKGHCFDLPQTLPLGRWLTWQRQIYRNGKLREDRAEKLLSVGFDDKHGLKKGGTVGVRDATSGQPPRKKRKVLALDNDLAAITHDEGEK
eukprot:scaffold59_cov189-Chaetoceros_neogracile.AAC.1